MIRTAVLAGVLLVAAAGLSARGLAPAAGANMGTA